MIAREQMEPLMQRQGRVEGELDRIRTRDFDETVPVFNVRARGAYGDGSTDDTTAIQAALDSAADADGIVAFPPGTYLTDTLRLYPHASNSYTPYGRVRFVGQNVAISNGTVTDTDGAILQHVDGSANPLIEIIGGSTSANKVRAVEFRDLLLLGGDSTTWLMWLERVVDQLTLERIYGYQGNNTAGGGIYMQSCFHATVRNVRLNGQADGTGTGHTGEGFVLTTLDAESDDATANMTTLEQLDVRKMGDGLRIGEKTEADGRIIGPVTVIGGQVSNCDGQGCIIGGKVRGLTLLNHHAETNYHHGYLIGSGANNVKLLNAVHNGNGVDGSGYDIYIGNDDSVARKARDIQIDGCYFQNCSRGIFVGAGANVYGIEMDHLILDPASAGSGTAINIDGSFDFDSRIILGHELDFTTGFATDISDAADHLLRKVYHGHVATIGTDTTPGVRGVTALQLNPGSTTTYTNFDDGFQGQVIAVTFGGNFANVTIQHGTNIFFKAGSNFSPADANDTIMFLNINNKWRQVHE